MPQLNLPCQESQGALHWDAIVFVPPITAAFFISCHTFIEQTHRYALATTTDSGWS
jgi:hypothetical protein